MFYCREEELGAMNRRYERGNFECIVIYGRRRVGKTSLINEFCRDKPVIYFSALHASAQENLEELSRAIYTFRNPGAPGAPSYRSYADALDEITRIARQQRLIFVIDEYPCLAKAQSSISSRLQHLIDHEWQDSGLYLILCGSSMSFMEYQVLGYESPLYGRRTAQFKLQALTYREMTAFHPQLSCADQALLYGVAGGIPHYINKLEVEDSIDKALLENLFNTSSYLFEEPENLLKRELREPAVYNSIITAIAGGASRASEIASKAGLESSVCAKYLRVLMELGILKKEMPIEEKSTKKTIYSIEDNFFRFWYRFVPGNRSVISAGRIRQIYERAVKQYYPDYMGLIFEKMCREYLQRYAQNLPVVPGEIGQWWGTDPELKKEVQIDIVGTSLESGEYLIGSCKYCSEKIGVDELELLRRYASVFRKGGRFHYCIFSKGGFTPGLLDLAEKGEVLLYTLEDLYR